MSKKKSKNETTSNKDIVKDSSKSSDEKSTGKRNRVSEAGKGDKPRIGITRNEWEKKWEEIFRPKKKKFILPSESNNSSSES